MTGLQLENTYLRPHLPRRHRISAPDSLNWARRIVSQPAMAAYRPEEYKPGAHVASDEKMLVAADDLGTTIFRPVGTVRMGPASDRNAVLDERLRVRGVSGLRVVDASVVAAITSGNTNSPTIMIAEKGADMILKDNRQAVAKPQA